MRIFKGTVIKTGIKQPKVCKCGKYKPKSTKGLIINDCRNCGGKKPIRIVR